MYLTSLRRFLNWHSTRPQEYSMSCASAADNYTAVPAPTCVALEW